MTFFPLMLFCHIFASNEFYENSVVFRKNSRDAKKNFPHFKFSEFNSVIPN